jgi:hypothetical protein
MSGVSEAIEIIRSHQRRGAYDQAAAYADSLPCPQRRLPLVACERARIRMRQGRMNDAAAALTEADHSAATAGQSLVLALETATLQIYREAAIRKAVQDARAALAAAAVKPVDRGDQAEAERVYVRIVLSAAQYYEVPRDVGRQAFDRLPALAETLEATGRIAESLAAHQTHAERIEDPAARREALRALAVRLEVAGRPDLAGETLLALADLLLTSSEAAAVVRAALDAAEAQFAAAEHVIGPIDVRRGRARLAVEREAAPLDGLEACLDAYRAADYPKGELSTLLDLSSLATDRGEVVRAEAFRRRILERAEEIGMGLVRENARFALADVLMRRANFGGAVELCRGAIAAGVPTYFSAGYNHFLSTALAFVGDLKPAIAAGRESFAGYEKIGAEDLASIAALKLANDLDSRRMEEPWREAIEVLEGWIPKDERRGDLASSVQKRELLAQIHINRYAYSPIVQGDRGLLDEAERVVAAAEGIAARITTREAARRRAALKQLRGQICQLQGDDAGVVRTWQEALAIYEPAGLAMEAANCRYILGALFLNRANVQLLPNFGEAERCFRGALDYYESAGKRDSAADTRFMFARLYANAAPRAPGDLPNQLLDAALGHLAQGADDYDAVRADYALASVLEALKGKQNLVAKSKRLHDLALEILIARRPDPVRAWDWVQRAKARALCDALGGSSVLPARVTAALERFPESQALVNEERDLARRIETVSPAAVVALRAQLTALRQRMSRDPRLADYLDLRLGGAVDRGELETVLRAQAEAGTGRSVCCADWVAVGDRLWLLAWRAGEEPRTTALALGVGYVRGFLAEYLRPGSLRSTLRDLPEILRDLDPLVAPLSELTAPEDLLILSPTSPLHVLPLHALEVDGDPLLVRNPIVYCASLGVLRQCVTRRGVPAAARTAALFGDPTGDRAEAAGLVAELARVLKVEPVLHGAVTRQAFATAVARRDIVHFQGHAEHEPSEALESRLKMADGSLTARDVFGLREVTAGLVTLGACESAASLITAGDEPLGLIPAFLYAGARSVLAALWPVRDDSAAEVMRRFYGALLDADRPIHKAEALRRAVLAVRDDNRFAAPYHWAAFVLHGDWH